MRFIIALMAILALPAIASSATIVVPDDYATIQEAINASVNGDVILVKPGEYVGTLNFSGKDIIVRSDKDALVGTEDIDPDNTIINGNQVMSAVLFTNGETSAAVLKGFTIRNGIGINNGTDRLGGGVFCLNASPTISNNIIRNNTASFGAGLCAQDASANPLVTENTFVLNNASKTGGAIQCNSSSPTISHNTIQLNIAGNAGGGIDVYEFCTPLIFNNIIKNNESDDGGGIECYSANPIIVNNIIKDNKAESGGGIYCYASAPTVTNNTFYSNEASLQGGAMHCYWYSQPIITNCIMWADSAPTGIEIGTDTNSTPDVQHCDVQGGYPGLNNINADPLFLNPTGDPANLHLGVGSPCIDVGEPLAPGIQATDFNHEPRVQNLIADIGVDEYYPYAANELHVPAQYLTIQDAINAAPAGATVYVATEFQNEGSYVENLDFLGKAITVVSDKDSDPLTHDIDPANTTIDGNSSGPVVRFANGETATSVLDGFTLRKGNGEIFNFDRCGGGIFCNQASPTIINNVIRQNQAKFGGGVHCEDCSPTIESNTIENNTAAHSGGGIMGNRSTAAIDKNVIRNNSAAYIGGAINAFQYTVSDITNNIIYGNSADYGAAIGCYWSAPAVANNTIVNNTAVYGGGAFFGEFNTTATIYNNILWGNAAATGKEIFVKGYSAVTADFCNVDGGFGSAYTAPDSTLTYGLQIDKAYNMLNTDPMFVDAANDYYMLADGSPCINRGVNSAAPADDFAGTARPVVTLAEMGAYEYTGTHELDCDALTVSATAGGTINFSLDAGVTYDSRSYFLLGAVLGSAPGTDLSASAKIPLNLWVASGTIVDPLFTFIMNNVADMFPGFMTSSFDTSGVSSCSANFIAGALPAEAVGYVMHYAFTTKGPYDHVSNPVGVEILP